MLSSTRFDGHQASRSSREKAGECCLAWADLDDGCLREIAKRVYDALHGRTIDEEILSELRFKRHCSLSLCGTEPHSHFVI